MKCAALSKVLPAGFLLVVTLLGASSSPLLRGILSEMPEGCKKHFCAQKHESYPQELVDGLLQTYQVSLAPQFVPYRTRGLDEDDTEIAICKTTVADYSPIFEVRDNDGLVRVVIQADNFTQQVRIEECSNTGVLKHTTNHLLDEHINLHNFVCEQSMMEYSFLVLDHSATKLESLRVQLPVYCACRLRDQN